MTSPWFADKAPEQVWAILLDEGVHLCSVKTMYRILHAHNQVRERRNQATHPPRSIPELHATGPDQVWSWDVTKLRGPLKGVWFCAYVIIDIFSRKIIHAEVHPRELEVLAKDFLDAAVQRNGGVVPSYVHSDNGSPMIAKTVTPTPVGSLDHGLDLTPARLERQPLLRSLEQDPEVRSGLPRRVRVVG